MSQGDTLAETLADKLEPRMIARKRTCWPTRTNYVKNVNYCGS